MVTNNTTNGNANNGMVNYFDGKHYEQSKEAYTVILTGLDNSDPKNEPQFSYEVSKFFTM